DIHDFVAISTIQSTHQAKFAIHRSVPEKLEIDEATQVHGLTFLRLRFRFSVPRLMQLPVIEPIVASSAKKESAHEFLPHHKTSPQITVSCLIGVKNAGRPPRS